MKDFDKWNAEKIRIENYSLHKYYHPRDIWCCSLGVNTGNEQDGKNKGFQRPVLILKAWSKETCLTIPLTTSLKLNKYRIPIGLVKNKESKVIISQLKTIDTKRLVNKITVLDTEIFKHIRKSVKESL